jgi:hypothetical protein
MRLLGGEKGIGCFRTRGSLIAVPEVTLEPFIAVLPTPAGAVPMGAGFDDVRDVAGCHRQDPKP